MTTYESIKEYLDFVQDMDVTNGRIPEEVINITVIPGGYALVLFKNDLGEKLVTYSVDEDDIQVLDIVTSY